MTSSGSRPAPGIARRLACAAYESLILAALVVFATFPFLAVVGDATGGLRRHLLQAYVLLVAGAYLAGFWRRGQTLAMKTWRIRLEAAGGGPAGTARAIRRYLLAVAGLAALGLGFLWALVDRDGQYLHDRLAGTRLVDAS